MGHLEVAGKSLDLFPARGDNAPLVLLHTVRDEGEYVYQAVRKRTDTDHGFVAIGGMDWDNEMSPWAIPPISKNDTPCAGGANIYLGKLVHDILPEVLRRVSGEPRYIALAGYSLAGLFAVYAIYQTDRFSRVASASGSFWFPNFLDYVKANKPKRLPDRMYLSLGDREAKTRNKVLQPVEENTHWLKNWYQGMGTETILEMNPGNHFQHAADRMAKGIAWILEDAAGTDERSK